MAQTRPLEERSRGGDRDVQPASERYLGGHRPEAHAGRDAMVERCARPATIWAASNPAISSLSDYATTGDDGPDRGPRQTLAVLVQSGTAEGSQIGVAAGIAKASSSPAAAERGCGLKNVHHATRRGGEGAALEAAAGR